MTWSWGENGVGQQTPINFDDEDEGKEQQLVENEQYSTASAPAENSPAILDESLSDQTDIATSSRHQRIRKRPTWMEDYEVSGLDHLDDTLTYFALFSDCDPIAFKDAAKE